MAASHLFQKMKYTHVIWDFNGTVLRDMEVGIRAINQMLAARGLKTIDSLESYRELFGFPVEDYYARLGLDLSNDHFKKVLAPEWVALYNEYSPTAPLFDGVRPLALALRKAGVRQSILSASEKGMMEAQLAERGALDLFDEIFGMDTIHAYGKMELADAWRSAHETECAILIGDTTHDYEVALRMGVDCILVADGHHSRRRLLSCGVPVVSDLFECAEYLFSKKAE